MLWPRPSPDDRHRRVPGRHRHAPTSPRTGRVALHMAPPPPDGPDPRVNIVDRSADRVARWRAAGLRPARNDGGGPEGMSATFMTTACMPSGSYPQQLGDGCLGMSPSLSA